MSEDYQTVLVHDAGQSDVSPGPADRTVADLVDPLRPGDALSLVNVTTKATGQDTADWPIARILSMTAVLETTAAQLE